MKRLNLKSLIIVLMIEVLICIEYSTLMPMTKYITGYYNLPAVQIQNLNIGFFIMGIFSLFFGKYTETKGTKRVIQMALLISIVGSATCMSASTPLLFTLGRGLSGMAYIVMTSCLFSYLSELTPLEIRSRMSGYLKLAFGIGMAIGPMLGAYVAKHYGFKMVYGGILAGGIILLLLSVSLVSKEPIKEEKLKKVKWSTFLEKRSIALILSIMFMTFSLLLMLNYISVWGLEEMHWGTIEIGFLYTMSSVGTLISIIIVMAVGDKIDKMKVIYSFFVLMIIGCLFLMRSNLYLVSILFIMVVMIGGDGSITMIQILGTIVHEQGRAKYMMLLSIGVSMGGLLTTTLGRLIYETYGFLGNLTTSIIFVILSSLFLKVGMVNEGVNRERVINQPE